MYGFVFFVFSIVLVSAAVMVVALQNTVYAVFFLILVFFSSAVLWIMMQSEFLALVLIFIYVGAIMTLFLFVVMSLNTAFFGEQKRFTRFLSPSAISILLLISIMAVLINSHRFGMNIVSLHCASSDFSSVRVVGNLLYTSYLYPLEISAIVLLVATIAAVTLVLYRSDNIKMQRVSEQLQVTKSDRLQIIKDGIKTDINK
ncbi:NADH-quinone oxidoreductase subunit J [Coxiella endosymbiont of Amblyomma sculptum]|uniref:NADH-quinone oxidoreductase subunit J n=1 Tax=Coxiella endosymbiont of Amblyomma sculptum TaxID=2487929 RepID=UPI001FEB5007|nr:NADH-quinone oxidoreductase subunit J [Coxiella endosymbiont of Amblyomma sculptum]